MRRKEIYILLLVAGIMVLLGIGFAYVEGGWRTAWSPDTDYHTLKEEGGDDVQDPPPSAVGDIDEP